MLLPLDLTRQTIPPTQNQYNPHGVQKTPLIRTPWKYGHVTTLTTPPVYASKETSVRGLSVHGRMEVIVLHWTCHSHKQQGWTQFNYLYTVSVMVMQWESWPQLVFFHLLPNNVHILRQTVTSVHTLILRGAGCSVVPAVVRRRLRGVKTRFAFFNSWPGILPNLVCSGIWC